MDPQDKPKPFRVLVKGGEGEIIEKKSRFIASIKPVESEEEALRFMEEKKKQYWDARHNCSAYVIGNTLSLQRCSDDGEPSGTAGRPMLEVLTKEGICNVVVVVTRYFGGILLGTGGLVRAYTQAVKAGLENCQIGTMCYGRRLLLHTDYNGIGKIQYILGKMNIPIEESSYTNTVEIQVFVKEEELEKIKKEITEATSGQCGIEELEKGYTLLQS